MEIEHPDHQLKVGELTFNYLNNKKLTLIHFLPPGNKEKLIKWEAYCLSLTVMGDGSIRNDDCIQYGVPNSASICSVSRPREVRIINCFGGNVQNCVCHSYVTCPFWGDPEPTKTLEAGLECPNCHFHPGLCPAVSQVVVLLWTRLRVRIRGHQIGLAGTFK